VLFDHLQIFRDIVRTGSLSRGAALNGVSQSAASQRLHELEQRFGVCLLDRSTRPFTLTPAGRLYYDFCRDALRRKQEFDAALVEVRGRVEGAVRVASIYSVGISEMARLRVEFGARFPDAHLEVEYLRPDKVYEAVLNDQADVGLVSYPEGNKDLAVLSWRDEEMALAASPAHILAYRSRLTPADLAGHDFIAFDPDLPIRRAIDRYLREHGISVPIAMHFDNIQMVKEAVALGAGVSILPVRAMREEMRLRRLTAIPITPEIRRPVGVIHRRRKRFSRAVESFLGLLQEPPPEDPEEAAPGQPPQ